MPSSQQRRTTPSRALPRRPSWLKRTLVVLLVLTVATAAFYGTSTWLALDSMRRGENVTGQTATPPGSLNLLLVGSDPRAPLGNAADVVMILHVPASGEALYLVSIPRHAKLPVPGENRTSAAAGLVGMSQTARVVDATLGVTVDHAVRVDTEGFLKIADVLGGVTIDNPQEISLADRGMHWPKGRITLHSDDAYAYVTLKDDTAGGDQARTARHQAVVKALISQAKSPAVLANPLAFKELTRTVGEAISVDQDLTIPDLLTLLLRTAGMSSSVKSTMLPTTSGDAVDATKCAALGHALATDSMSAYVAAHPEDFR